MKLALFDTELNLPGLRKGAVRYFKDFVMNKGLDDDGNEIPWTALWDKVKPQIKQNPNGNFSSGMTDVVSSMDLWPLLKTAMEEFIRPPIDPIMVVANLYTKVKVDAPTVQVLNGIALGMIGGADDIGESGTYPEFDIQLGGGTEVATIGKCGLMLAITEEAVRYCTWDIMSMLMSEMGRALMRHKERKAVAHLRQFGVVLYDNTNPTASHFGTTTGLGSDGEKNGSIAVDDFLKVLAYGLEQGYPYTIMLVCPLMYLMFTQDPVMREMYLNGNGGAYTNQWNGNIGSIPPWTNGSMGAAGPTNSTSIVPGGNVSGATPTPLEGRAWAMNATFNVPGYSPMGFRVIASPFIPFNASSGTADIFLLSEGNVGILMQEQEPTIVSWDNPEIDRMYVKMLERYSFMVANQGFGIGLMKNVNYLQRNYFSGVLHAMSLDFGTPIDPTAPIV